MSKSGFTQAIDRIKAGDHYDPTDPAAKRLIKRIEVERKIANKAAKALLDAGFKVSVDDGEEVVVTRSSSIDEILEAMFSTDEDYLYAIDAQGKRVGKVYFVYGNDGPDVINDYSTTLEIVMAPVHTYADGLWGEVA